VKFSTWDALGNRYVVVPRTAAGALDPDRARELSADTDGVLEVVRSGEDDIEVVIWNPDGSQAELSGNGTRIAAAWLAETTGATSVRVRVGPREVLAHVLDDGRIEQEMGSVEVGPAETVDGVEVVPVSVGNPHAVVVADLEQLELIGPRIETHPRFPDRVNVELVRVDGPGIVTARVWERGVGETNASGTGAVQAARGAAAAGVRGESSTRPADSRAPKQRAARLR
jgi:diaminopimelate epimerase